jgi:hypothetical protein
VPRFVVLLFCFFGFFFPSLCFPFFSGPLSPLSATLVLIKKGERITCQKKTLSSSFSSPNDMSQSTTTHIDRRQPRQGEGGAAHSAARMTSSSSMGAQMLVPSSSSMRYGLPLSHCAMILPSFHLRAATCVLWWRGQGYQHARVPQNKRASFVLPSSPACRVRG